MLRSQQIFLPSASLAANGQRLSAATLPSPRPVAVVREENNREEGVIRLAVVRAA